MSKQPYGGMFDFNHDGKTTWTEEMLGLSYLEEDRKRTERIINEQQAHTYRPIEPTPSLPTIKPVPDIVDASNYKSLKNNYKAERKCAIIVAVIALIPAIIFLYAVFAAYDPDNSAAGGLTLVLTIITLLIYGMVLKSTGKTISVCDENIAILERRYAECKILKTKSIENQKGTQYAILCNQLKQIIEIIKEPSEFSNSEDIITFDAPLLYKSINENALLDEPLPYDFIRENTILKYDDGIIYNFCAVTFPSTNYSYYYLTGNIDVKIGDKVLVPVGNDGEKKIATVVATSQHLRANAPYPVDKAKSIIRKV